MGWFSKPPPPPPPPPLLDEPTLYALCAVLIVGIAILVGAVQSRARKRQAAHARKGLRKQKTRSDTSWMTDAGEESSSPASAKSPASPARKVQTRGDTSWQRQSTPAPPPAAAPAVDKED